MKISVKYKFAFIALILTLLAACSAGNKNIPTPGGGNNNEVLDTSSITLNSFNIVVTGDTSFVMSVTSHDTMNKIVDDSLMVSGFELSGAQLVGLAGFKTFQSIPGTYLTEMAPPSATQAEFGIFKVIRGQRKLYGMNHGQIVITQHDTVNKLVRGWFDVNNKDNTLVHIYMRCRGAFYIKYR